MPSAAVGNARVHVRSSPGRSPGRSPSGPPPSIQRLPQSAADAGTWARQVRVRQWPKNLLVFAVPLAADAFTHTVVLGRTIVAFLVFCLLSSGVYLLNDVVDAEDDRRHPVKRHRPIAAGVIGVPEALVAAGGCLLVAIISSGMLNAQLLVVALLYTVLNFAYTTWLRHLAILDMAAVGLCFVLRALAGGAASGLGISTWFIIVVCASAFLVAGGRRYADALDPAARRSRAVLRQYSESSLRVMMTGGCAVAVLAYLAWSFGAGHTDVALLRELAAAPFAVMILRYAVLARAGEGGAPEAVILRDRQLQAAAALWLLLFVAGA